MKIDEEWECWTLCAITIEGMYRGREGTTPVTTACPNDRWGWNVRRVELESKINHSCSEPQSPITEGQSNQDLQWAQKPIYTPIFTHHIRSWLLCTLVIVCSRTTNQNSQSQNPLQCPVPYIQRIFLKPFPGYHVCHNTPCATAGRTFHVKSYIQHPPSM